MPQPTFRRFFIKVLPDGSAKPEFDPITGDYHGCGDYEGPVAQIIFYRITPKLADLIRKRGDLAEASDLKTLQFDIPPGSEVEFHRRAAIRIDPVRVCAFCRTPFDWDLDECPKCLARDQWYCGKCDKLEHDPIVDFLAVRIVGEDKQLKIVKIPKPLWGWAWKVIGNIGGGWQLYGSQARCKECEKTEPRGLMRAKCIAEGADQPLYTSYSLDIDGRRHIILDYKLNKTA